MKSKKIFEKFDAVFVYAVVFTGIFLVVFGIIGLLPLFGCDPVISDASASSIDHRLPSSDSGTGDLIIKKPAASADSIGFMFSRPGCADWLDILIEKIHAVEASGQLTCPDGDGGRSVGPMQLTKAAVGDVNYYWGTHYSYEDRRDLTCAKQIARLYISMWIEIMQEEIAARIYNGGPRGFEKESTKKYFDRINGV